MTKTIADNILSLRSTPAWYEADKTASMQAITRMIYMSKPMPKYTLATLPAATDCEGFLLYVTDGVGDKYIVISNGTAWFYMEGTPA